MKNLLILAVAFSALIGCQKPDLSSSPLPVGTKTNCVGGGCSDAARSTFNTTIDQNGNIWHSSKEDLLKKDPTQDGPKSWWNSTADSFFSPGSTVNKPDTGSVPLPKDPDDSDTNIVDSTGGPSSGSSSNPGDGPDDMKVPPKKGKFSDSDLGKGFRFIGSNLEAAWGEITGANQKKRKKAKELKKQINEAKTIGTQIALMVEDMNTSAAAIQAAGNEIMKGDRFTRTGEIRGVTSGLAGEQNTRGNRLIDETTDISEEVSVPAENPLDNTPELRSIKEARFYLGYVERKIEGMDQAPVRKAIVRYSRSALDSAEAAYHSGDNAKGDLYKSLAISALDISLSLIPGVGWGKDIYEVYTGTNLLTGEKLTDFEMAMGCVGILTAGYGSKLSLLGKGSQALEILAHAAKNANEVEKIREAGIAASQILEASTKIGDGAQEAIKWVAEAADNIDDVVGVIDSAAEIGIKSADKVKEAKQLLVDYLGEGASVKTNSFGDKIFISKDGTRKARFDVKNPHGDLPHMHIEKLKPSGKWADEINGKHRIRFDGK